MPTYYSTVVRLRLIDFAVALAGAARIFTVDQLARRSEFSGYREPVKRAREFLSLFPDTFETMRGPYGEPARRRLTARARRIYGIDYSPVSGITQRSAHWLTIGDVWMELTANGGRPAEWRTEWDRQFDVYCVWRDQPYLLEVQRTPITSKQWRLKWQKRIEWYRKQQWSRPPRVVLVDLTNQQDSTIQTPKGTVHVRRIENLHHALRPPQK